MKKIIYIIITILSSCQALHVNAAEYSKKRKDRPFDTIGQIAKKTDVSVGVQASIRRLLELADYPNQRPTKSELSLQAGQAYKGLMEIANAVVGAANENIQNQEQEAFQDPFSTTRPIVLIEPNYYRRKQDMLTRQRMLAEIQKTLAERQLVLAQQKPPIIIPALNHYRTMQGLTENLHKAVKVGDDKLIKSLLDQGANVNARNKSGMTALHYAITKRNSLSSEIVELLLEYGANINAQNTHGNSPLYLAAQYRRDHLVELLLENGADHTIKNNKGKTALDIADRDSVKKILLHCI